VKEIVLVLDGDAAGAEASRRGVELLEEHGMECRVAELPSGVDPAAMVRGGDAGKLQELTKSSITGFDYVLAQAADRFDSTSPEGKESIFRFLLPFLNKVRSEVRREGYLVRVAEAIGVEVDAVRRDFRHGRPKASSSSPVRETKSKEMTPDLYLMMAVAANMQMFAYVRGEVDPDSLNDERARALFIGLEECYRRDEADAVSLLARLEPDLKQLVMQRLASPEFEQNGEPIIRDSVRRLKQQRLMARRESLIASVRRFEREAPERVKDLLVEQMVLDREIEKLRVAGNVGRAE
jgi:DNA primase